MDEGLLALLFVTYRWNPLLPREVLSVEYVQVAPRALLYILALEAGSRETLLERLPSRDFCEPIHVRTETNTCTYKNDRRGLPTPKMMIPNLF